MKFNEVVQMDGNAIRINRSIRYDDRDYLAGPYHVLLHAVESQVTAPPLDDGSKCVRRCVSQTPLYAINLAY